MRNLIFISYSHRDKAWFEKLQEHLRTLVPDREISIWSDAEIKSGERFEEEIAKAIASAKVAVLLLSDAFLDSDFILEHELPRLVAAAKRKEITLIWIPVGKSSYKATPLKNIQAASDPTRPLETLSQDESEKVLDKISKKIVATADRPDQRRSLTYYVNYVPFVAAIAIGGLFLAAYLNPSLNLGPAITRTLLIILGLSGLWIVGLGVFAYKAFNSNQPIPAPEIFWHLFFNELATVVGRTERLLTKPKVIIVADNGTQDIARQIEKEYHGKYLEVEHFICPGGFAEEGPDLAQRLKQAQALYLFRTEETEKSKRLWKIINRWVVEESHKPVLVVDFLPNDYKLPFTRISEAQAIPGIWKLLAHGNERANLWRRQARTYRQFWVITVILLIILSCLLILSPKNPGRDELNKENELRAKVKELADRDKIDTTVLWDFWTSLDNTRKIFTVNQSSLNIEGDVQQNIRTVLSGFAQYALRDLLARQGKEGGDIGRLTFWRKFRDNSSNKEFIVQVASSDNSYNCFPDDNDPISKSIIGCAIRREQFVMYRRSGSDGAESAWNINGELTGRWSTKTNSIEFIGSTEQCSFQSTDKNNTGVGPQIEGLICLGIKPLGPDPEGSGVCIATPQSPDFLATNWTRNYLLRSVSIMRLIPDRLLIPKDESRKCEEFIRSRLVSR